MLLKSYRTAQYSAVSIIGIQLYIPLLKLILKIMRLLFLVSPWFWKHYGVGGHLAGFPGQLLSETMDSAHSFPPWICSSVFCDPSCSVGREEMGRLLSSALRMRSGREVCLCWSRGELEHSPGLLWSVLSEGKNSYHLVIVFCFYLACTEDWVILSCSEMTNKMGPCILPLSIVENNIHSLYRCIVFTSHAITDTVAPWDILRYLWLAKFTYKLS